jgi:hypothetical protein
MVRLLLFASRPIGNSPRRVASQAEARCRRTKCLLGELALHLSLHCLSQPKYLCRPSRSLTASLPLTQSRYVSHGPRFFYAGEALLRRDIQYDFLAHVFGDATFRFTPPQYPPTIAPLFPTDRTWSFAELYLDAIANSGKAARNLKDKMAESQAFAVAFGKVALLINAGRINTTISCQSTRHPRFTAQKLTRSPLKSIPKCERSLGHITLSRPCNATISPGETFRTRRG